MVRALDPLHAVLDSGLDLALDLTQLQLERFGLGVGLELPPATRAATGPALQSAPTTVSVARARLERFFFMIWGLVFEGYQVTDGRCLPNK